MNALVEEYIKMMSESQKKRDSGYPEKYRYDYGITEKQWISCLNDERGSRLEDRVLLKQIYRSDNHLINTSFVERLKGYKEGSIIFQLLFLAQSFRGIIAMDKLKELEVKDCWKIMFWGRQVDQTYELKLKPELVRAIEQVYPELLFEKGIRMADAFFNDEMADIIYDRENEHFTFNKGIRPAPEPQLINGLPYYQRSLQVAKNAVVRAGYECEINDAHQTFIADAKMRGYNETVHLIPLEYQPYFDVSLDVEENVVCLCANCVRQMQYGYGRELIIKQLYNKRKNFLKNSGIEISLDRLLEMYNTESNPEEIKEVFYHKGSFGFDLMS